MSDPTGTAWLAAAETWLFAPAHRPDVLDKALTSRADLVVLDLEDGVPGDRKEHARELAVAATRDPSAPALVRTVVRTNPAGTELGRADLAALDPAVPVMLPKATLAEVRAAAGAGPERRFVALVESAAGLEDARAVAEHPGVDRLAFGHLDFAAEAGADPDCELALVSARSRIVQASVLGRLPGPVDGVFARYRDTSGLLAATLHAKALGFAAKLCIHPTQCPTVSEAFAPTDRETAWARSVLAVEGAGGAQSTGDELVDEPVLRRARRVLSRADEGVGS